jgi:hypothetical protein
MAYLIGYWHCQIDAMMLEGVTVKNAQLMHYILYYITSRIHTSCFSRRQDLVPAPCVERARRFPLRVKSFTNTPQR